MLARPRAAALDEAGDAEAMMAALDQVAVEGRLVGPAELRDGAVEGARVVAAVALCLTEAVVRHDGGEPPRHLGRGDEIAAADVEAIKPEVARREIEQALAEERALVAARGPVRAHRRLVAHHRV